MAVVKTGLKKFILVFFLIGFLIVPIFCSLAAEDKTYGLNPTASLAYGKDPGTLASNPSTIMGAILGVALASLGISFMVQIVIAGFQWLAAGGNEEKITAAKNTIIHALIGLVIVVSAYALVSYVLGLLLVVIKKV